jgi:hypothetical protein
MGLGSRIQDPGYEIWDPGSRINSSRIQTQGHKSTGSRIPGPGFQIRICNTAGSLHIIRNPDPDPGDHKSYGSNGFRTLGKGWPDSSLFFGPESVATLPPFSPIEGQKWFDQISSQWESQKNRFALTYFGKIQFLPPCIWNLPFMTTASV